MMLFYIILIVIGIIFLVLFTLLIINSNKMKLLNYKINEAENTINKTLVKKNELLNKINDLIKEKGKEEALVDIDKIEIEKLNMYELNNILAKYDKEIVELRDYNKDIIFDEEEEKIFDDLYKQNNNRLATEKYFNDNSELFNKLIKRFPNNIIAKIKGYEEKELFSNKKEEIFEILKK